MRATSLPLLAAFIALAGFDFIPCQTAAEAARPKYYFPQAVKREVTNGWYDAKRSNEEAELVERGPAGGNDVVVIPVTLLVDGEGNTKTITGVPGGKPTDPPKNPAEVQDPAPVTPIQNKQPVQQDPVNTPIQDGGNTPTSNTPVKQPVNPVDNVPGGAGETQQNPPQQPKPSTSKKPVNPPNTPIENPTKNPPKVPTKNPVDIPVLTSPKNPPNQGPSTSRKPTVSKPNGPGPSEPNNPGPSQPSNPQDGEPTDDPILDIPGIVDGILPGSSTPVPPSGSPKPNPNNPTNDAPGITVGLTGIIPPKPTDSSSEDDGLLPSIIDILPTSSGDGIFPTLVPNPGDGTTTTSYAGTGAPPSPSSTSTSSDGLDITDILPPIIDPTKTKSGTTSTTTSDGLDITDLLPPIIDPTTTKSGTTPTTTSDGLDITDILPPIIDPTKTESGSTPTTTYESGSSGPGSPTEPTTTDDGIDLPIPTLTDLFPTLPTLTIPSLPTGPLIPPPSSSGSYPTPSESVPSGTSVPSDTTTATETSTDGSQPTSPPSDTTYPGGSSAPSPTPTSTTSEDETTTTEAPSTTKEPEPTPEPTDDDSDSTQYVEPSIIVQPTQEPDTTAPAPTTTDSNAVPTPQPALPDIISPNSGTPSQPPNTTLIQLGFDSQLNYQWVYSNSMSISQIFLYVPQGVAFGLDIPNNQVVMESIRPYNLHSNAPYTTTLALAYIPEDLVNLLSLQLHNPNSKLYQHPDESVHTIMSMLDPTIPLDAGQGSGILPPGEDGATGSDSPDSDEGGAPGSSSSGVRPSSVGIGVGVVCGAAVYGAAMFFVARRYRNKRREHRRSSSVSEGEYQDSPHDSAMMSGARDDGYGSTTPYAGGRISQTSGGSARTQMISAPVMAENSLGWN